MVLMRGGFGGFGSFGCFGGAGFGAGRFSGENALRLFWPRRFGFFLGRRFRLFLRRVVRTRFFARFFFFAIRRRLTLLFNDRLSSC